MKGSFKLNKTMINNSLRKKGKTHKKTIPRRECNWPINIPEDAQLHINEGNINLSRKITLYLSDWQRILKFHNLEYWLGCLRSLMNK